MSPILDVLGIAGYVIEAVGVLVTFIGMTLSAFWFLGGLRRLGSLEAYHQFRKNIARSIILGLEFLIAGDIIRTVTVDQTLKSAAVLALIVLIRILLSLTLEYEISRRWPRRRPQEKA